MTLRLNGTTSGYVEIDSASTGGNNRLVLPSSNGSANQFLKNGSTAGTLGWSSLVETATGVGIGTASPGGKFAVSDSGANGVELNINETGSENRLLSYNRSTSVRTPLLIDASVTRFAVNNGTEAMRITDAGYLWIKRTTAPPTPNSLLAIDGSTTNLCGIFNRDANDDSLRFTRSNVLVGSISVTTTATAYNTSSDYRLKENVAAVTDGITRLQQLKPSRFNFIADANKTVDGFIAHEVQAVVPEAITGEKDAIDADGNPVYQGIDQSKLVPLLTAALQEAIAKIETLEAANAALETRLAALEAQQ